MTLTCYSANTTDKHVRGKTLTSLASVTVTKQLSVDMVNPVFVVRQFEGFGACNYFVWNNRKYIATVEIVDGAYIKISGHSDVLENVSAGSVSGILTRSSSKYNSFADTGNNMLLNQTRTQTFKFDTSLPSQKAVLVTTAS